MVTGFTTMPDSNFFTCATWAACASGSKLRWITPMPPACAMAMASLASVTVSMAEDMTGICREIERVTREEMSTSFGSTLEAAGLIRTSSKVSAIALVGKLLRYQGSALRASANLLLVTALIVRGLQCGGHRLAASFSSFSAFWEASSLALAYEPVTCSLAALRQMRRSAGTAGRPPRLAGQVRRVGLSKVKEIAMNKVMAMTALAASLLVSSAAIAAPIQSR